MIINKFKISSILTMLALLSIFFVFLSYNYAYGIIEWKGGATSEEFNRALDELNKQNENEQQKAANSPTITYQYTFSYDKNNGSGNMENEVVEAKTQHNTTIQDPGYTFPENGFSPPLFQKFKCWTINDKEYSPGDRINTLKSLSNNNFSNTTIHVTAIFEIDNLALLITGIILLLVIFIIWILYMFFTNNKNLMYTKDNFSNNKKLKTKKQKLAFDEELIKYKKLLDEGVITQSEFDKKKKEILDL